MLAEGEGRENRKQETKDKGGGERKQETKGGEGGGEMENVWKGRKKG